MTNYIFTLHLKLKYICHMHQACYKYTQHEGLQAKGLGEHVSQLVARIDKSVVISPESTFSGTK